MNAEELTENELLIITLMRQTPAAEVQFIVDGELVSATRAGQILEYIQAIQAEAWDEGFRRGNFWHGWISEPTTFAPDFTNPHRSQS